MSLGGWTLRLQTIHVILSVSLHLLLTDQDVNSQLCEPPRLCSAITVSNPLKLQVPDQTLSSTSCLGHGVLSLQLKSNWDSCALISI